MSRASRRRATILGPVRIEDLDDRGRGVARVDGRMIFIEGALTGERVRYRPRRRGRRADVGETVEVLEASPRRVVPACPHYASCGGCRMQHAEHALQLDWKERELLRALAAQGDLRPAELLAPIAGPLGGYRRRARLGARLVPGKGGVLVGFREKFSNKVAALERCAVLDGRVGDSIGELARLLDRLAARDRVAQLEVSVADGALAVVLRHLVPLGEDDRARLVDFARARGWQLYLQPGGPDTIHPLWPQAPASLTYALPEFGVELAFAPTDFVQVNAEVNRRLVAHAVDALAPGPDARVLDLYCGIGNFSLALARRARHVTGIESNAAMVERARGNAERNRIDNVAFQAADLDADPRGTPWWSAPWDGVLLDPPRSGAATVLGALAAPYPRRIVYVSCNPQTLAADGELLTRDKGYTLSAAGVVDMFPHTAHCEAMAVFDAGARR
ncbi:MAG: 23S rRNA (uracil(1939)-C(5))-methyltransferase RlmD [Gammaproteobacteria bacterium]|nr:23S rRNA (uracil(1939)-C(5))-methyltransferase RlmD [Gammaproteobacteria bacterium]